MILSVAVLLNTAVGSDGVLINAKKLLATKSCSYCDFTRADLRRTNLNAARLSKANLFEANLNEANLRGADLSTAILETATIGSAILCKTLMPWGEDNSNC